MEAEHARTRGRFLAVQLWPYPRANSTYTLEVLERLPDTLSRAADQAAVGWRLVSSQPHGAPAGGGVGHRTDLAVRLQPRLVALDPPRPVKGAAPSIQKTRPLWTLLFLTLLVMFGLGSFEVGITLRGQQTLGLGPAEIGLIFTVCGLVMVGVQAVIFSPLITRFGAGRMLAPAFLVMAAGLWVLPYGTNLTIIGVLIGLTAAGAGVLIPALAYLVSLSAEAFQGKALGRQTAAASLGQALGSVAAGALFGIMAQAPFWLPMALLLLGVGISLATVYATPQPVEE